METEDQHLITMIHHLRILISQIQPQTELTFGEYFVLYMIDQHQGLYEDGITPTELNRLLKTKKPATSRMLTALENKEYLIRTRGNKDQRINCLTITQKGNKVLSQEKKEFCNKIEHVILKIGRKRFEEVLRSMEVLEMILDQEVFLNTV